MREYVVIVAILGLLAGCANDQKEQALYFNAKDTTVVLHGLPNTFCTPTFQNIEQERNIFEELGADAFYNQYCPEMNPEDPSFRLFSYMEEVGAFQEWNPGGYQELGLYTKEDIDALEAQQNTDPAEEGDFVVWATCERNYKSLSASLTADVVSCTDYRMDVTQADPEIIATAPATDCFIPLQENLFFGIRNPVAPADSEIDGCDQLKQLGVTGVKLR